MKKPILCDERAYWVAVAAELAKAGLKTRDGKPLDPDTLEILAETHGLLRRNIPDPVNMARNAVEPMFYVQAF